MLLETNDPEGRRVVLDEEGWRHIVQKHMEIGPYRAAVMDAVSRPDHREDDQRPVRERFWQRAAGPSRWLFVVVDFGESPARVVTAFGRRDDPPGWRTT